jgi:hypothetical protein
VALLRVSVAARVARLRAAPAERDTLLVAAVTASPACSSVEGSAAAARLVAARRLGAGASLAVCRFVAGLPAALALVLRGARRRGVAGLDEAGAGVGVSLLSSAIICSLAKWYGRVTRGRRFVSPGVVGT